MTTLYHAHGSWYMQNGQEITLWQVIQWQEQGVQMHVIETEVMD